MAEKRKIRRSAPRSTPKPYDRTDNRRSSIVGYSKWLETLLQKPFWTFTRIGRPISYKAPQKGVYGFYNPRAKEKLAMKWTIKLNYHGAPVEGPISIFYIFEFAPPRSLSNKKRQEMISSHELHLKKPDTDNLMKFYNDCLKGVVFTDDNQIATLSGIKIYGNVDKVTIFLYTNQKGEKQ